MGAQFRKLSNKMLQAGFYQLQEKKTGYQQFAFAQAKRKQ